MSITMYGISNSGAGATGGLSFRAAILHVSAPYGSTVTISKSGATTKSLGPEKSHRNSDTGNSVYYFSITPQNYGTWTVTATDGTRTASDTISITTNNEYEVALYYRLYIIKNGIWQIDDSTVTKTSVTTTQQTGYIQEKTTGNVVGGVISPSLDITPYDSIVLTVETGSLSWNAKQCPALGLSASIPSIDGQKGAVTPYDDFQLMNSAQGPINAGTYTLAISLYSGAKYLWITCSGYSSALGTVNIVDWYLA